MPLTAADVNDQESYAGVYVPTLAKELLDNAKGQVSTNRVKHVFQLKKLSLNLLFVCFLSTKVNFKGLSVGDPCTDNVAQQDSMDMLWYGHKYGFVPDQEYDLLWNTCQVRSPAFLSKGKQSVLKYPTWFECIAHNGLWAHFPPFGVYLFSAMLFDAVKGAWCLRICVPVCLLA